MRYKKLKIWFEKNWNDPVVGWILAFTIPVIFIPLVMIPVILIPVLWMEMIFNLIKLSSHLFTGGSFLDNQGLGLAPENLLIGLGIIGLALIFYFRLKPLADKSRGTFILNLRARWTNPELLKGRTLIYSYLLKATDASLTGEAFKDYLITLGTSTTQKDIENYFSILEVLAFLHDLGYMYIEHQIEIEKVASLFRRDTKPLFDVFESYVIHARTNDPYAYEEFVILSNALKEYEQERANNN